MMRKSALYRRLFYLHTRLKDLNGLQMWSSSIYPVSLRWLSLGIARIIMIVSNYLSLTIPLRSKNMPRPLVKGQSRKLYLMENRQSLYAAYGISAYEKEIL